ncbi:carbamoyl-phosphate synthase large subunit [Candidatus Micrarchaeota archaeon]|nr:carbamoyl-phosphate synthase large subunit [Candidatus Micrarchaeota archaeon]
MKKTVPKNVLVIGSGPIVIGQAAEFDYSGTQCCKALKEEGVRIILVNSNPATIQTDFEFADKIYIEPLTKETLTRVIEKEKPEAMIATMAGQTGLNLAIELKEVLKKHGITLLGTSIETIQLAEDREQFQALMKRIKEPVPPSQRCTSLEQARGALKKLGLPLIIRPDFTLGGTGSGIVHRDEEFEPAVLRALELSATRSALIERSLEGLAEFEYEVIRDAEDNCITICNMENLDAMGVHTGESMVVAPSQTLTDKEYHFLRASAIKIVRALGVRGACNIQFALNQKNGEYWIIEVNPRTSRSSALASKATGYPIARVATKIALGYSLHEIENRMTGQSAAFEPSLDYVVLKIPKWPFDKLRAQRGLGTQMKSTGEVMAIERSFEACLHKAMHSLEMQVKTDFRFDDEKTINEWLQPNELRLLAIQELLSTRRMSVSEIAKRTMIHPWFIERIERVARMENELKRLKADEPGMALMHRAKQDGFSDQDISRLSGLSTSSIRFFRNQHHMTPVFKMVDTCSAEFPAKTPYYYSSYDALDESQILVKKKRRKIAILGSGPIRIGQGIEFDYCSVHAVLALKEKGFETLIINNNPETVSTDFDIADKLYFEPLTTENVLHVLQRDPVEGVLVQFGGQTAVNLALPLHENGINVLGTSISDIDASQNRKRFKNVMQRLRIPTVESGTAFTREEAVGIARGISYPLLVRPSYVLGGRAMEIVYDESQLLDVVDEALFVSGNYAILMDRFLEDAIEVDVDALADGTHTKLAGIMEQIEEAGVHSGDSSCVLPTVRISKEAMKKIRRFTIDICRSFHILGLVNIQMAVKGDAVYVLEVNPRASRTIPFLSKATGIPLAKIAASIQVGGKLTEYFKDFDRELIPPKGYYAVKAPVFPFRKFADVDPVLSPEMKSTGEVMGVAPTFEEAFLKAMSAAGHSFGPTVYIGSCGKWRKALVNAFREAGIRVLPAWSPEEALTHLRNGEISFIIDGIRSRSNARSDSALRREAVQRGLPVLTSAYLALQLARSMRVVRSPFSLVSLNALHD